MAGLSRSTPATSDVLRVLLDAEGPAWGLLIAKEAQRPTGSVYPILARLESAGWVESIWEEDDERRGARRRLYTLTAEGAKSANVAILKHVQKAASRPGSLSPVWTAS
jgi:PadR family transcriptional regulator PadR